MLLSTLKVVAVIAAGAMTGPNDLASRDTAQRVVPYSDLHLASQSEDEVLRNRLATAIEGVCEYNRGDRAQRQRNIIVDRCVADTHREYDPQVEAIIAAAR